MNTCRECGKATNNPSFCSQKCAGTHNLRPYWDERTRQAKKDRKCPGCGGYKYYNSALCHDCFVRTRLEGQLDRTLEDATMNNGNARVKWAHVRSIARRYMELEGRLDKCEECEFDARVEVSHVRPISEFSPSALLREVNAQENMRALCPNHHTLHEMALSSRQSG